MIDVLVAMGSERLTTIQEMFPGMEKALGKGGYIEGDKYY